MHRHTPPTRLPIRQRQTHTFDHVTTERTVFCAERDESVALEACIACSRCGGFVLGATPEESYLSCDVTAAVPLAPSVAQIMTAKVLCVQADLGIGELAHLLLDHGISGVPVVDAAGHPLGMVSKTDLVRIHEKVAEEAAGEAAQPLEATAKGGVHYPLGPGFHAEAFEPTTVGDIMTPLTFSLPETAGIAQAAALMAYERVHRLPIVSRAGVVVGILSSLDILRWLGESGGVP